ncbi:MAG: hypothetical protein ACYTBZ_05010 [Planctomycetota bacterium]|jgi:hypothetical protein
MKWLRLDEEIGHEEVPRDTAHELWLGFYGISSGEFAKSKKY